MWSYLSLYRLKQAVKRLLGMSSPADEWVKVDWTYILEKLVDAFPAAETNIMVADRYYKICSKTVIVDFLASDETNRVRYVREFHDCDDFSFRLMGQFHKKPYSALAFGITWSDSHAYNVAVCKEGVFLIEPQSDVIFKPVNTQLIYKTRFVLI